MSFMFSYSALGALGETLCFFPNGLIAGGPVVLVWSWLSHIFFSFCIATYLGEMCSAYPYVGSVYYWSYAYAPTPEIGRPLSYIAGLFNFFGCMSYDASVAYAVSQYLSSCNNLMSTTGTELPVYTQSVIAVIVVVMWTLKNFLILQNQSILSNLMGVIALLSGVVFPLVIILCSSSLSDSSFVFTEYINYTGLDDS